MRLFCLCPVTKCVSNIALVCFADGIKRLKLEMPHCLCWSPALERLFIASPVGLGAS